MNTYNHRIVFQPDQYTTRFAHTNESGASTAAIGRRYGRGRSGSRLRRAVSDTGAIAYIRTVAEVTSDTRLAQLGNGSSTSNPITQQKISAVTGTPRPATRPNVAGA